MEIPSQQIKEPEFHYTPDLWDVLLSPSGGAGGGFDISGWLQ
jgi:hypothetical protein